MNYPNPSEVFPNNQYISVVIPTYCRPYYLKKALETLRDFADFRYEVIVHDDASTPEFREQLFDMSNQISVTVFNNGKNMGLCESANRCVHMASSKYVLFLNDDCFFVRPSLKELCKLLDKPYIGTVAIAQNADNVPDEHFSVTASPKFCLTSSLGRGSTIAFRKEVWEEVGGFDTRSTSGQADNVFIYKIHNKGYWRGILPGSPRLMIGNFVYNEEYKPTQPFTNGNDCSLPRIFGLSDEEWVELNNYKRESCQWWVDGERTIPNRHEYEGKSFDGTIYKDTRQNKEAGLNDIPYWTDYFEGIFGGKHSTDYREIDWVKAEKHGQSKWKELILQDFSRK